MGHMEGNEHEHHHHHHDLPPMNTPEQMRAVLTYMCEHNESHTHELEHVLKHMEEDGNTDAAAKLKEAIAVYEKGNAALREVLNHAQ